MKKTNFVLSVVFLLLVFNTLQAQKKSKIAFTSNEFNMGEVIETNGDVSIEFEFTNKSRSPLLISEVSSTCGCTTPDWTKEAVLKGKTGRITVKFNPKGKLGDFNGTLTVKSNAETPEIFLIVKGLVVDSPEKIYPSLLGKIRWGIQNNYLNLGQITNKELKVMDIKVFNPGKEPVKLGVTRLPEYLKVDFDPVTLAPGEKGNVKLSYDAVLKKEFDYVSDRLFITYDAVYDQNIWINVGAIIGEDFTKYTPVEFENAPKIEFVSTNFKFDTLVTGQEISHEFTFKNIGKSDLYIRKVQASCGCTATVPPVEKIMAGETNKIKMTFNSSHKEGQQYKTITVTCNDPKNSRVVLTFEGFVKK